MRNLHDLDRQSRDTLEIRVLGKHCQAMLLRQRGDPDVVGLHWLAGRLEQRSNSGIDVRGIEVRVEDAASMSRQECRIPSDVLRRSVQDLVIQYAELQLGKREYRNEDLKRRRQFLAHCRIVTRQQSDDCCIQEKASVHSMHLRLLLAVDLVQQPIELGILLRRRDDA